MAARKKIGKKVSKLKVKKLGNNRALIKIFSLRTSSPTKTSLDS